jgi:RNA polymerase sigma-70 factor (ECF subfamily)
MPEEQETTLINQCQSGDVDAFRKLVEQHQQFAYRLAFRLVCGDDVAKDIVQESFIRVWRNLHRFDQTKKFTTWLHTIVVNLAYDQLRTDRRRRGLFFSLVRDDDPPATESDAQEALSNKELAERIRGLTGSLPPKQRMVFVLRDLQDLTIQEVAETLGMSASSVKANLCYARAQIRKRMQQMMR